jgi:hypothetical protein
MKRFKKKIKSYKSVKLNRLITLSLLTLFIVFTVVVIVVGPRPYKGGLQEGDIAKETIRAPFDFKVSGKIDQEATSQKKEEAAGKVAFYYTLQAENLKKASSEIDSFFNNIKETKANKQLNIQQKAQSLIKETDFQLDESQYIYLLGLDKQQLEDIEKKTQKILGEVLSKAVITEQTKSEIARQTDRIIITDPKGELENEVSVESIWTVQQAIDSVDRLINNKFSKSWKTNKIAALLLRPQIQQNITYNEKLTHSRKEQAKEQAEPVYKKIQIKENSIIVAKNQLVTKQHTQFLKTLQKLQNQKNSGTKNLFYYGSISLFVVILFILFTIYLKLDQQEIISSNKKLLLLGLLSAIIIILSKIISVSFLTSYLIPVASISMLAAILLNMNVAIMLTVFLSLIISIITGEQLSTFLYCIVGSIIGIYSVRNIRRRSQILRAGLLVGAFNSVIIIGIDLLHNIQMQTLVKDSLWGITNGIICAFIITGILPILEYMSGITTDISLLELSDLNHPLLKEMVIKAPGTYHHSLIVGNIAERAASAIGANPLLTRVGAYYHDIGKLVKPEYFSENQMGFTNEHAELSPQMSSLIIIKHVSEGLKLANQYKLPEVIKDFIQQHHGKSLTYYFYQQALEEEKKEDQVKEEEFRYPGPLPQTKEIAIVLLADSVEAATRSISTPNAAKIKKAVQKIINNKFIDGQLDECELTLKDLHKIAESFSKLLMGIYHTRLQYPEDKEES